VRVTQHWHRLLREAVESLALEILESHLDVVLGIWLQVALPEQGDWTRQCPEVLSSLNHSMVLGFCLLLQAGFQDPLLPQCPCHTAN